MKLLLTGGGTAGHIIPCLALYDYVKDYFDSIYFVGSNNGMEKTLVCKYPSIKYYELDAPKLKRNRFFSNFSLPFKLISSVNNAKNLLKEIKPDVVFSKGGYASLPVALATKAPLICHESDYTVGLANRLVKKKCKVFCCGFEDTAIKNKGVFTGTPLKKELYYGKKLPLFNGQKPILLVMGGSLGAKAINDAVIDNLYQIKQHFNVIHLVGKNGQEKQEAGYIAKHFAFNMADLYATADYVLSRGGATALCEIISLKKPSIIVPLEKGNSRGDQIVNAEYYQKKGLIKLLPQHNLQNLCESLCQLKNDNVLKNSLFAMQTIDGAQKIAEILKNAAAGLYWLY